MVAAGGGIDLGRAAELADRNHQRVVQKSALLQILEQCREADVEHRAEHVFQPVGVLGVRVPHRVVDRRIARLAAPIDVHEPYSGFDQPASQQQTLPPLRPRVAVADFVGLLVHGKRTLHAARGQQVERLILKLVVHADRTGRRHPVKMPLDLFQKRDAAIEPHGGDVRAAQPLDFVVGRDGSPINRSGSHCRPRKPPVWPAGVTFSLSRMMSGIQTDVSGGSFSLGLTSLSTEPK